MSIGNVLKNEERAMYDLRALYLKYGYCHFKVSKFEEYDLYAKNKNFLVSERILTFSDTNGKLMALKPDITLSIIKNIGKERGGLTKVCYNETVYRTPSDTEGFREIMQTGLECIGELDLYAETEVIMLALRSLETIDRDYILDLSHMGFLLGLFEEAGIPGGEISELLRHISAKNSAAVADFCARNGVSSEFCGMILKITEIYAPLGVALEQIRGFIRGDKMRLAYEKLADISRVMKIYGAGDKIYLDFSVVNDMNYYNDLIFRGFINGIYDGVLSGGRYDSLIRRLGKKADAIGFAVYLDKLERARGETVPYDADVLLEYEAGTDAEEVIFAAEKIRAEGKSVRAQCISAERAGKKRYREYVKIGGEGACLGKND